MKTPRIFPLLLFFALAQPLEAVEPGEPIISRINRMPVRSSVIATIGYSRKLHALEVEFRNGAIYRYLEVPRVEYRALLAAPSIARYYDRHIRGKFRSVRVRPRPRHR